MSLPFKVTQVIGELVNEPHPLGALKVGRMRYVFLSPEVSLKSQSFLQKKCLKSECKFSTSFWDEDNKNKRQWEGACSIKGALPSCVLRAAELPQDVNVEVGLGKRKTLLPPAHAEELQMPERKEKAQTGWQRVEAWGRGSVGGEMPSVVLCTSQAGQHC